MYVPTDRNGFSTVTDLPAAVPGSWSAGWGSGGLGQLDSFENLSAGMALLVAAAAGWAIYKAYRRA